MLRTGAMIFSLTEEVETPHLQGLASHSLLLLTIYLAFGSSTLIIIFDKIAANKKTPLDCGATNT